MVELLQLPQQVHLLLDFLVVQLQLEVPGNDSAKEAEGLEAVGEQREE